MKERLLKFMNKENLSSAKLAETIGVQPSSISHILSGRNKPGFDFIYNALQAYPHLNSEWLITGKGQMYKEGVHQRKLFDDYPPNIIEVPVKQELQDDFVDEDESYSQASLPNMSKTSEQGITNVTPTTESEDYKSNANEKKEVTDVIKRKDVQKIVIFYSDKTFVEYSPEPE